MLRSLLCLSMLLGGMTCLVSAEDKKPDPPKTQGKAVTKTVEAKKYTPATTIEFAKAFDLAFDSLTTLGTRIEHARHVCDPVALTSTAQELAVAEKVSGKKASLTSDAVLAEAVELAKLRDQPTELKALSLMIKDEALAKDLDKLSAKAKQREEEEIAKFKSGERGRGVMGKVHVQNATEYTVHIYINGTRTFYVNPYRDYSWHIGHASGTNTVIGARSACGSYSWQDTTLFKDYSDYTLYLKK